MYDKDGERPKVAKDLGNTQKGDGVRFHGRGYVQLTGRSNYGKAGKLVGSDLVSNADLALDPAIAGKILFAGMESGLFTSKKLGDYFNKSKEDWINACRIINRLDKAPNRRLRQALLRLHQLHHRTVDRDAFQGSRCTPSSASCMFGFFALATRIANGDAGCRTTVC